MICNFVEEGVETSDNWLAGYFIVSGGILEKIQIMSLDFTVKYKLIGEGGETIESVKASEVTEYIQNKGYILEGIILPLRMPKVIYKIRGDVAKLKSILALVKEGKRIEGCPTRQVINKVKELKNEAYRIVREFYEKQRENENLDCAEGIEIE